MDTNELESKILEYYDIVYKPIGKFYERDIDPDEPHIEFTNGRYYNKTDIPKLVKKQSKKPCDDCGMMVNDPSSRIKIKDKKCTRYCNNCSAVF